MILVLGCISNVKHIPSSFSGQLRLSWHLVTMRRQIPVSSSMQRHASLNGIKKILIRPGYLANGICKEVGSRRAVGCLWCWQAFALPPNPQVSRLSYHTAM